MIRRLHAEDAGASLDARIRAGVESATGRPLPDVRVHSGARSANAAEQMGARAFTTGDDIHLAAGESPTDEHLLAHEAAHTLQQRADNSGSTACESALELEADGVADAAAKGGKATVGELAGAPGVQMEKKPGASTRGKADWSRMLAKMLPGGAVAEDVAIGELIELFAGDDSAIWIFLKQVELDQDALALVHHYGMRALVVLHDTSDETTDALNTQMAKDKLGKGQLGDTTLFQEAGSLAENRALGIRKTGHQHQGLDGQRIQACGRNCRQQDRRRLV